MDEVTRIVAELRARAADVRTVAISPPPRADGGQYADLAAEAIYRIAARESTYCDALALALENGGGCWDHHGLANISDCMACHGTGIADDMRSLLAACGVQHG